MRSFFRLSLLANLILVSIVLLDRNTPLPSPAAESPPSTDKTSSAVSIPEADQNAAQSNSSSSITAPLNDPFSTATFMRERGYPDIVTGYVVSQVLSSLYNEEEYARAAAEQRATVGRSAPAVIAYEGLKRKILQETEFLVPSLRDAAAEVRETQGGIVPDRDQLRYGDLTPAQIAVVAEVEQRRFTISESEFETQIRNLIPPNLADDYLTYNSPTARRVQSALTAIDIDQATYLAIYTRVREVESAEENSSLPPSLAPVERIYSEVLGPENFIRIAYDLPIGSNLDGLWIPYRNQSAAEFADTALEVFEEIRQIASLTDPDAKRAIAERRLSEISGLLEGNPELLAAFQESGMGQLLHNISEPDSD